MATLQIPVSVLDLANVLEGKTITETFNNSKRLAQHAEQLGYKRFWLSEHHNMDSIASAATSVLIGFIAGATKSIRVGSGGIMLPNHAPLVIAEQFGTLASLYPGRIDLGLGRAPGTDQTTMVALRRDRMAAYNFPDMVTELLTYFSVNNNTAKVRAIPGEGIDVPVWILGSSTDSAYLAAAFGLPYAFASHFAPAQLMEALSIYRSNFKPSKYLQQPYTMAAVNAIAADTQEAADDIATSYKQLAAGILHGKTKPLVKPIKASALTLHPEEEAVLKQMMRYSFVGDKNAVIGSIQSFIKKTAVDELMIVSHIYDIDARLRSYELIAG